MPRSLHGNSEIFRVVNFLTFTHFTKYLNTTKLENIQTKLQTITSSGQCTHKITLESNIKITNGVKYSHVFLYHARNKLVKKATETVA